MKSDGCGTLWMAPVPRMKTAIWPNHTSMSELPRLRSMRATWLARSKVGRVSNSFFIEASLMLTPPCS